MCVQDKLQNKSAPLRKLTPLTGHAMRGRPCMRGWPRMRRRPRMRCRLRTGKGQRTRIWRYDQKKKEVNGQLALQLALRISQKIKAIIYDNNN